MIKTPQRTRLLLQTVWRKFTKSFFSDVTKDNERVESSDDLNIRQETSSVIMTTVRFNNTVMGNENVVLNSLIFRIYSYQDFPLKGKMLTCDRQYRIH